MDLNEILNLSLPAIVVSLTAFIASVTAAVLSFQQLLSGPRLRHLESTLREAMTAIEETTQQRVLRSMHAAALGRLVAREAVPGLTFLQPATLVVMTLIGAAGTGLREPNEWNVVSLGTSAGLGWMGVRGGLRLASERMRVARAFEAGISPIRGFTDLLAKVEGGSRLELLLSVIASAGFVVASARAASALRVDEVTTWGHVMPTVGGALIAVAALQVAWSRINSAGFEEPRNPDDSLKAVWVHPRGAVSGPATDVSSPGTEPEAERSARD